MFCAVTLFCTTPAFAADGDTDYVGNTIPNLAAAAEAMNAALNGGAGAPSTPETPTLPPDVSYPEVGAPDDDVTGGDDSTVDDVIDGIDDATAKSIIETAMQYLGVPYVWGGTTPDGFDCSGLVQYVFAQNGISLPRTTYEQQAVVAPVSLDALQPGDLVFWGESAYHVGIYIGDGLYIHAPAPGQNVMIQSYDAYSYTSAGRVLA